jgi:RNA polymerase sigma factor (sigma-70 family)
MVTISLPLIRLQEEMNQTVSVRDVTGQDRWIAETIAREQQRLRHFIRRRVDDIDDADDILQDVLYELVEATRLMKPIEHVSAWLFRVARNRITDLFRKGKPAVSIDAPVVMPEREDRLFEDLLPSVDAGPEAAYARTVLLEELDAALDELPDEQRDVFVAHEIEGRSFKELAAATGVGVNTLLARKHYAVLRLRRRLQAIYDDVKRA